MTAARILIVDDNALNVQLAAYVLRQAAYTVDAILDSRDAMARVETFRPHLILMDIQMPEIGGLELMQQIKAQPTLCHIPVVAFTAYAMQGDEDKLLAAGCDGYLSKPIDVAVFAAQVQGFLDAAAKAALAPPPSDPP